MKIKNKFGYCNYDFVNDYVHIYNLFVFPKYRRQGKARQLLQQAIMEIRNIGWTDEIQIVANPINCNISKEELKEFYKSLELKVYEYYG